MLACSLMLIFSICFKELQNLETWLFFCLRVCSSIPNIFLGDNGSLIQLVPWFLLVNCRRSKPVRELYGEWSRATKIVFLD